MLEGGILIVLFVFIGLEIRPEDVVGVFGCRHEHLAEVGMETQLLYVVLALVQEHKLRRDLVFIFAISHTGVLAFIDLDGKVPDGELIVG